MNLSDFKEQIQEQAKALFEKAQESSLYIMIQDRYENLSPVNQRIALIGAALCLLFIVFYLPITNLSESSDNVDLYNAKRELIRELLKVHRDSSQVPQIPEPPSASELQTQIRNLLSNEHHLLPEQVGNIGESVVEGIIPRDKATSAVAINLVKLNIRQVMDIAVRISKMKISLKMTELEMRANSEIPGYFDVIFKLVALKVPQITLATLEEPTTKKGSKGPPAAPINKASKNPDAEPAGQEEL